MFTNNRMARAKTRICNSNVPLARHNEPKSQGQGDSRVCWRNCHCRHTHTHTKTRFGPCYMKTLHHSTGRLDVSLSYIWKLYRPRANLLSARITSFEFIFENLKTAQNYIRADILHPKCTHTSQVRTITCVHNLQFQKEDIFWYLTDDGMWRDTWYLQA